MIRSIHTQIIVLDMCATNARYLRTEISCQPSGRFELVVTLRCSVVHIQNFAIKISASETGAESLQITYHLFRGTRHHESRMDRATGNRHGVSRRVHKEGRTSPKTRGNSPQEADSVVPRFCRAFSAHNQGGAPKQHASELLKLRAEFAGDVR